MRADIVSTSHKHFDHNYTQAIQSDFFHVNKSGHFSHKGIEFIGVATFHDNENGAQRGKNTIYKFIVDGVHICHCGDLGQFPISGLESFIQKIGNGQRVGKRKVEYDKENLPSKLSVVVLEYM